MFACFVFACYSVCVSLPTCAHPTVRSRSRSVAACVQAEEAMAFIKKRGKEPPFGAVALTAMALPMTSLIH